MGSRGADRQMPDRSSEPPQRGVSGWFCEGAPAVSEKLRRGAQIRACLRHDLAVENEALQYARKKAPDDVQRAFDWLISNGFQLAASEGGETAAFGDVFLHFSGAAEVRIVRDRVQWDIQIGPAGQDTLYGLAVLVAASHDIPWVPPDLAPGELPPQLPPGVVWQDVVPAVVRWLQNPGADDAARRADEAAREVMRQRWR